MSQNRKRIFIAINLPERVKNQLIKIQYKWAGLPIYWTKPENLHITLVFLGYMEDEEMYQVCQLTKQALSEEDGFEIKLNRVCLALNHKLPRMVWARGEINQELVKIKTKLENTFLNSSQSDFTKPDKKVFHPHITLGRINLRQWQQMPQKPIIEEEINLSFMVDSVQVMQSLLKSGGAEYIPLESVELK